MKKVLLIAAIAVFGFTSVQAQEGGIKAGLTLGLPIGDTSDGYTFAGSVDLAYLFAVADSFQVGPALSYIHYIGDEIFGFEVEDASFLPVAASARFYASEQFFFGADLGYAVGLSPDGNDGGFYYKPKAGYSFGSVAILASYSGISVDGGTFSAIGVGVEFGF